MAKIQGYICKGSGNLNKSDILFFFLGFLVFLSTFGCFIKSSFLSTFFLGFLGCFIKSSFLSTFFLGCFIKSSFLSTFFLGFLGCFIKSSFLSTFFLGCFIKSSFLSTFGCFINFFISSILLFILIIKEPVFLVVYMVIIKHIWFDYVLLY